MTNYIKTYSFQKAAFTALELQNSAHTDFSSSARRSCSGLGQKLQSSRPELQMIWA